MANISIVELEELVNDCRDVIIALLEHLYVAEKYTFDIVNRSGVIQCYIHESSRIIRIDTELNVFTNFLKSSEDTQIESILKRSHIIMNILE